VSEESKVRDARDRLARDLRKQGMSREGAQKKAQEVADRHGRRKK